MYMTTVTIMNIPIRKRHTSKRNNSTKSIIKQSDAFGDGDDRLTIRRALPESPSRVPVLTSHKFTYHPIHIVTIVVLLSSARPRLCCSFPVLSVCDVSMCGVVCCVVYGLLCAVVAWGTPYLLGSHLLPKQKFNSNIL